MWHLTRIRKVVKAQERRCRNPVNHVGAFPVFYEHQGCVPIYLRASRELGPGISTCLFGQLPTQARGVGRRF